MKARQETVSKRTLWFGMDTGLFVLLFYLYVWLVMDPRLIHHSLGIHWCYDSFCFFTGWPFFEERLARPGGLIEYGAAFLSQFYYFGWLGALIISAAAWYMCLCTDVLTRLPGQSRGMVVRYVPAVLLLAMYSRYSHPLSTLLSLLAALSCFVLYLRLAPIGAVRRSAVLLVTCVVLYHIALAGSLLFPALVAVHEFLIRRRILVAGLALLCGLGVPWIVGKALFGLPIGKSYGEFVLTDPGSSAKEWPYVFALYLFFPAALAGTALWRAVVARRASRAPLRRKRKTAPSRIGKIFRFLWCGKPKWTIKMAIVLLAAGATAWFALDARKRIVLEIDYYSQHEKWAEVLEAADRMPRAMYHVRCNRNILMALHHTGRLGDEMFCYPQMRLALPPLAPSTLEGDSDYGTGFQQSRMYLELGQVNCAEKYAYEALETTGNLPAVLEQLAVINVLKDRPETARIFLNALSRNPLHRRRAREMLRRLEEDPRLADDPRMQRIRSVAVDTDSILALETTAEDLFLPLLFKNRQNKMAFDFLMAHYLSIGRPDKIMANRWRLNDFGYREIPRHYQEAMIIYYFGRNKRPLLSDRRLDRKIVNRARQFTEIMMNTASKEQAASRALAAGFGDSFFFYLTFDASGL